MDLKSELLEYMEGEVENGDLENAKLRWGLIGSVVGVYSGDYLSGIIYTMIAFSIFFILNFLAWRAENPMEKAMRHKE
jgi:hypothetical protein